MFSPTWIQVVGTGYGFHTITRDLENVATLLPNVRSLQVGQAITTALTTEPLLKKLLRENPKLEEVMRNAKNETEALIGVRNSWAIEAITSSWESKARAPEMAASTASS